MLNLLMNRIKPTTNKMIIVWLSTFIMNLLLLILLSPSFPSAKSPWLGWQAPEQSCSLLVNITYEYIKINTKIKQKIISF